MGRVLLTPAAESDVAHLVHYFFSQSAEVASRKVTSFSKPIVATGSLQKTLIPAHLR